LAPAASDARLSQGYCLKAGARRVGRATVSRLLSQGCWIRRAAPSITAGGSAADWSEHGGKYRWRGDQGDGATLRSTRIPHCL